MLANVQTRQSRSHPFVLMDSKDFLNLTAIDPPWLKTPGAALRHESKAAKQARLRTDMKLAPYWIPVTVLALAAAFLAACGGAEPAPDLLDLVPAEAQVIAWLEIDKIREEPALGPVREAISQGGASTGFQEWREGWDALLGEELGDFSRAVVFAVPGEGDNDSAFIMEGMPDGDAVLAWAAGQSRGPTIETQYHGAAVFVDEPEMGQIGVSFLSDELTVLGNPSAVYRVIDVHQGNSAPVGGMLAESFQGAGDNLARVVVAATPDVFDRAGDGFSGLDGMTSTPIGNSLEDLEFLILTVSPTPEGLRAEVEMRFEQVESADATGSVIEGLVQLGLGFSEDAQQRDLLGRVTVEVDGNRVVISLPLTGEELAYLAAALGGG